MLSFENISERFSNLKGLVNLQEEELKKILEPKKVLYADLKVDGKKIPAWRIVSSRALGPAKGGIRFHPEVNENEIKTLSFLMTLKNSLLNLPYGGSKGGVKFNPKEYDQKFLEKVSRFYIDAFYKDLGENKDIPAPDVSTNSQTMSWMLDQYEKKIGEHQSAMITGKPVELGGIALRSDSAAKGAYIIIEQIIKNLDLNKETLTIAIQGFGNVGLNIAKILYRENFKIVAANDSQGGVYNGKGIDMYELIKFKEEYGVVSSCAENKAISNKDLLELDVDILILAALENQVTEKNVSNIKAKHILEIANGPVDYKADKILFEKGIMVWPDILASSGGVVVSYFEWSQNKTGNILDEAYLTDLLNTKMTRAFHDVYNEYLRLNKKIDIRSAAYVLALNRIIKAERLRGNL